MSVFSQGKNNDDVYGARTEKTSFDFKAIPIKNGEIVYEDVNEVPGIKKDSLLFKTKEWLIARFGKRFSIIKEQPSSGSLVVKVYYPKSEKKTYKLFIDLKDENTGYEYETLKTKTTARD